MLTQETGDPGSSCSHSVTPRRLDSEWTWLAKPEHHPGSPGQGLLAATQSLPHSCGASCWAQGAQEVWEEPHSEGGSREGTVTEDGAQASHGSSAQASAALFWESTVLGKGSELSDCCRGDLTSSSPWGTDSGRSSQPVPPLPSHRSPPPQPPAQRGAFTLERWPQLPHREAGIKKIPVFQK